MVFSEWYIAILIDIIVASDVSVSTNLCLFTFSSPKANRYSVPLEIAAVRGHTKIVEKLIAAGAVINYQNKVYYVSLHTHVCEYEVPPSFK